MTESSVRPLQPCILRIFNGPLRGCEFALDQARTLFIVAPLELLGTQAQAMSIPEDAIFVPLEQGGRNFEVLLDDDPGGVTLRLLGEPAQTLDCPLQQLMHAGGLQVALRYADQCWAPPLLDLPDVPPVEVTGRNRWPVKPLAWVGAGLLMVVALVASTGFWPQPAPVPEQDVRRLIGDSPDTVAVVQGRDQRLYVFVASERDAGWSRQVLMRHQAKGRVLVLDQERRRLENLLVDHDPQLAWHALDLKDPAMPRLLLSAQRHPLTAQRQAQLFDAVLEAAPYAREVAVQVQDDNLLADLAEQGLRRLALTYSRVGNADSVTFAIGANLQDAELATARQYVDAFHRQWGDRYVHFAVELKDDALKGKSFQTGPRGYIKTTSSSWHFPKQL
ncbi:PrgH/EprH family type III secretion apparatus protein [Pseudomonas sp. MYb118]|uniref:PrgH/EprH family type III secretion apparatus protein n=1 Tax=Pseudomonas sp. MYb118 TaxID=1848720 RepID=UPI0034CEBA78